SPVFQNNLGVALERSGYPVAAAKAYEAAIAADSAYSKAAVSLARVTEGGQEPESEPVDLGTLAQQFMSEIEAWRESTPANDSTATDSNLPVSASDSAVPLSDSTIPVSDSTTEE
ncbi:MAG TPA: hypothetical protein VE282_05085, partial [Gemmatimonadales bacterium]|nr:hypothetical protein [Gemmatimonadales bacterium]